MGFVLSAFADEIDADLGVQFEHLLAEGITLIDLRSAFGKNVMQLSDAEVLEVRRLAEDSGLGFNCVASPINKVAVAEGSADDELAKLVRASEIAGLLGINRIRIFSPDGDDWAVIEPWMAMQVGFAAENDLVLMHENDGKYYGSIPGNAQRLFETFGSPSFMAAFDFANSVQHGFFAMKDWFPWLLPHLETVHIKDAREDGKVVPAGEGVGQVRETLVWLKQQSWEGVLSIEPHLQFAGDRGGFSGTESFGIASRAIKGILEEL
ncbi:MAG: TIM barrel protein [Armatimonadota bacterium]